MNGATHPALSRSDVAGRSVQDNQALPADQRRRQALARIEASRSALIVCLAPNAPARHSGTTSVADDRNAIPFFAEALLARIERNGLLQGSWRTVRTLVRRWWTRQSWHSSIDLVGKTLAHQASPLMRRHPLATLAVGAALGAGLVAAASAARPWAWQHIQRHASPWRDRMGSLLWTQLTSAPVQMALAGALAAWLADQGSRNDRPGAHSADAAPRSAQAEASPRAEQPGSVSGCTSAASGIVGGVDTSKPG
jgi:hypothetical protein